MIAVPAIDLRDGCCVQLVGGEYAAERVRIDDPVAVATHWIESGFSRLHIVDLDAATRRGSNADVVRRLLAVPGAAFQVGGGLRTRDQVAVLVDAGADRVVVGTRAISDMAWLEQLAREWPARIVVAADVRGENVVSHGWATNTGRGIFDVIAEIAAFPIVGMLVTAVDREGLMQGPDGALVERITARSPHRVIASGGIGSVDDLAMLAAAGAAEAVIGMALYTGALDIARVTREFGQ